MSKKIRFYKSDLTLEDLLNQAEFDGAIDASTLPNPDLLFFYERLERREVFINSEITDYEVDIAKQILEWNMEDKGVDIEKRTPIKLYINTDGGLVDTANAIIGAISVSKTPVWTIGMGKVYSAGFNIFIATKLENRYILPTTQVMMHDGSAGIIDNISRIIDYSKYLETQKGSFKKYVLSHTSITDSEYKEIEDKDKYFSPEECIQFGIAGQIITDVDVLF